MYCKLNSSDRIFKINNIKMSECLVVSILYFFIKCNPMAFIVFHFSFIIYYDFFKLLVDAQLASFALDYQLPATFFC